MTWSVNHDPVLDIIEVTFTGRVSGAELRDAASQRIALQKELGSERILINASEEELTASSLDVFNLPSGLYVSESASRKSRLALVLPTEKKSREIAQFYETACKKLGWVVQIFSDRQSGVAWLDGGKATHNPMTHDD